MICCTLCLMADDTLKYDTKPFIKLQTVSRPSKPRVWIHDEAQNKVILRTAPLNILKSRRVDIKPSDVWLCCLLACERSVAEVSADRQRINNAAWLKDKTPSDQTWSHRNTASSQVRALRTNERKQIVLRIHYVDCLSQEFSAFL